MKNEICDIEVRFFLLNIIIKIILTNFYPVLEK